MWLPMSHTECLNYFHMQHGHLHWRWCDHAYTCSTNGVTVLCSPSKTQTDLSFGATGPFQSLLVILLLTRLDYGNAVYVGLPAYLVQRLWSVLNVVAQMIFHQRSADHITDALATLHWLHVRSRLNIEITLLTEFFTEVHRRTLDRSCQYAVFLADNRFILQAPIVFWCHRSSDQLSVAVLSHLLAWRPRTPCQKMYHLPSLNTPFTTSSKRGFSRSLFQTSTSSDNNNNNNNRFV